MPVGFNGAKKKKKKMARDKGGKGATSRSQKKHQKNTARDERKRG